MKKIFSLVGIGIFFIVFCLDICAHSQKDDAATQSSGKTTPVQHSDSQGSPKNDNNSSNQQKNIGETNESLMNNAFNKMIHNIDQ